MKKVISITIGSRVFQIEDDAYELLASYLRSVKQHFAQLPDGQEIIEDIETGIAEKFQSDARVITSRDVTSVIQEMGTVEDISHFDEENSSPTAGSPAKRLYRDTDTKVIGGVCAGLAAYLGIDRVYVRLAFLLALFLWGFSVVAYILLWIIIPAAKTKTQKLAMQGEHFSLATLQSSTQSEARHMQSTGLHFFNRLFALVGAVFEKLFQFLRVVLRFLLGVGRYVGGTALALASILGMALITFLMLVLFLEIATPYFDPVTVALFQDFGGYVKTMLLGFGYIVLIIPLLLLLLAGISLVRKTNVFSATLLLGAVAVWALAGIGLGVNIVKSMPVIEERVRAAEAQAKEGQKEYADLAEFKTVATQGSFEVRIEPGDAPLVRAQGTPDALAELIVRSHDGQLLIERHHDSKICLFVCPSNTITLTITTPDLEKIEFLGSTRGTLTGFQTETMKIHLAGSNRLVADIESDVLSVDAEGSSRLELRGKADQFNLEVSGSSRVRAYALTAAAITVQAAGSSTIEVAPGQTLQARLSGSNILRYIGDDVEVDADTTPASHVRQVERDEIDDAFDESFEEIPRLEAIPSPPRPPSV